MVVHDMIVGARAGSPSTASVGSGDGRDETLKRERAGTYRTVDGRFTVEQSSSGWLVLDASRRTTSGCRLTRGPFADARRGALGDRGGARSGPGPTSDLAARRGEPPRTRRRREDVRHGIVPRGASRAIPAGTSRRFPGEARETPGPRGRRCVIREIRALRRRRAARALEGSRLHGGRRRRPEPRPLRPAEPRPRAGRGGGHPDRGIRARGWDGRRGWIYHVATASSHRRQGVATRLIRQIESGLRDLGCRRVNAIVRDENDPGGAFWTELGYEPAPSRPFRRDLGEA